MTWYVNALVSAWKKNNAVVFEPFYHCCSHEKCTLIHLHAFACEHCKIINACDKCTQCAKTCIAISNVYVCQVTGIVHICGASCNKRTKQNVCSLTCKMLPCTNSNLVRRVENVVRPMHTIEDMITSVTHEILFSQKRVKYELYRFKQQYMHGRRLVIRALRDEGCCNIYTLVTLFYSAFRVVPYFLQYQLTKQEQNKLICMYSSEILKLWQDMSPSVHCSKVPSFTIAVLYIMRKGLTLRNRHIIQQHAYLNILLPDANAVNKVLQRQVTQTLTRNVIIKHYSS